MDLTAEALKMAGALVVVLLLMGGALWVVKWFLGHQQTQVGTPELRLLGGLRLGPGKAVMLVDIAGEVLVLGATSKELTLLTSVKEADRVERLTPKSTGTFAGLNTLAGGWWTSTLPKRPGVIPEA